MRKIIAICLLALLLGICMPLGGTVAHAQTATPYDPAVEGILSGYYGMDGQYITGIAPGTAAQKLRAVCAPAQLQVSTDIVGTGTTVSTVVGETTVTATAVVTGDLNGDSSVSITDLLMIKSRVLGNELESVREKAGDLNGDGLVTITDFLKIKAHILGQSAVTPVTTQSTTPMVLLEPGHTAPWGGGVTYGGAREDIAAIDENGNIHALAEGSSFVYAYDAQGNLSDRIMVTVLSEPLTVSLGQDSMRLIKDRTHTLVPVLNHPVSATLTWQSSDPAIVTVENGVLQGIAYGSATVTVTLENGNQAQIRVDVIPALTGLSIERKLYKVKPNADKALTLITEPADGGEEFIWSSSDPAIASVKDGVVTGHKYGTVTVTATGKHSGITASCRVKVCNVKQVAFTFDDGPSAQTTKLLNFLKESDIRVTFFLVGNRITSYEKQVLREMQEGHEIGYHSYDHKNQTRLSDEVIKSYFQKSDDLLREITGQGFTVWRTPGGNYDQRVLDCVELPHILWSVDSQDWVSRSTAAVYRAIRNCPDGSIVLMHDLYSFTVNGAIQAMTEMQAGDYEFLTVTELLSRDGTPPEPSVNYRKG